MKRTISILLFTLSVGLLSAAPRVSHNYAYRHFTTRDGLPQMQVMCAFQDADGYIWFGTKDGVSRYDGISFKNYNTANGLPYGVPKEINQWGDKIVFVYQTSFALLYPDERIRIIYFPKELSFDKMPYSPSVTYVLNEDEFIFANLAKPTTKVFNAGVYKYSLSKNTLRRYLGEILPKDLLLALRGDTLLGIGRIYKLDHQKMTVEKLMDIPTADYYVADRSLTSFLLRDTVGIKQYIRQGSQLKLANQISTPRKNAAFNNLLYLYGNTLIYLDDNQIKTYPDKKTTFGISLSFIHCITVDKENNLWVLSENGVYNFFNLSMEEWRLGLADNESVWSIVEDNQQNMWFGSYGFGLWKMDISEKLIPIHANEQHWKLQYFNSTRSASGDLYFPYPLGIARYRNNRIEFARQQDISLGMYFDNETNTLYSGAHNGVTRGLKVGYGDTGKFYGWDKNFVTCIAKDAHGKIRLGSFRGQGTFTGDTILVDTVKRIYRGVICMSSDSFGRLWKGTDRGVFVELPDGSEKQLSPEKIPGRILSLHVYRNKYLLLGGNTSLYLVRIDHLTDYRNPEVWEITYDRGFTGLESGQNGFFEDSNGDVWLTTALCMLKFNPEKLIQSQTNIIPPIRVSKLYYSRDNATWEQKICDKSRPENFKLKAYYKFLKFAYISNSISAPNLLRFKYRLKGFSDKWSNPTYTKNVEFTNLNNGEYQFEVQCSLDGINWSPVATTPVIQIVPPLWKRWYMLLLYSLAVLMLISGAVFVLLKRNQRKKVELLNRQKLENELQLRTLHSKVLPHFTKNVLTAIGHFAMDDHRKAGHYISQFSKFTHLTLENSDKNYNKLENELNYIETYLSLEKMRFDKRLDYTVSVGENVDLSVLIPAMALHTYCDNAIRHGIVNKSGEGNLHVTISKKEDGITIQITDNGIGRKRSAELGTHGNQMGLQLIQQQLDFYNRLNDRCIVQTISDLEDKAGNGLGTKVELYIPDGYRFTVI